MSCSHVLLAALLLPATAAAAPRVDLYVSVGTEASVEVRGRALDDGGVEKKAAASGKLHRAGRNLERILADDLEHRELTVTVAGKSQKVVTDAEGRLSARFTGLPRGEHRVSARLSDGSGAGLGKLIITTPGAPLVISDLDDTLVQTHVTDRKKLVESALFEDGKTQEPVAGMAAFLSCLRRGPGGAPEATVHYLSGSPLAFYSRVVDFLSRVDAPLGEVLLRNYGMGKDDDPLDGLAYKLARAPAILSARPGAAVVLVGDSGEADPEVYRELSRLAPGRVKAVYIRFADGGKNSDASRFEGQVAFASPREAARDATARGLVDAACAAQVEAALSPAKSHEGAGRPSGPPEK